jgi:hypothetical protein
MQCGHASNTALWALFFARLSLMLGFSAARSNSSYVIVFADAVRKGITDIDTRSVHITHSKQTGETAI